MLKVTSRTHTPVPAATVSPVPESRSQLGAERSPRPRGTKRLSDRCDGINSSRMVGWP